MTNRKYRKGRRPSRLKRIERTCDQILSELAIIRQGLCFRSRSVDDAIERMHRNTRRMREDAVRNVERLRMMFHSAKTD